MPMERLSVVVTRRLPPEVETRLSELFDVRLLDDDVPMSRTQLVEAMKSTDILVPTITDRIDAAMIGQAGEQVNGIYEADYRDFNRETYVRGRETFDRTWAEVKEVILGAWWRDVQVQTAEAANG